MSPMREDTYQRWKKHHGDCSIRCTGCRDKSIKPERGEDEIVEIHLTEAMGWDCFQVRKASEEELASIARARAIRDAGILHMREQKGRWN
jgi:hypothetical protein